MPARFRIRTKALLITYPQDDPVTTDQIHQKLEQCFGQNIQYLIIATEHHQDGGQHHHVCIFLKERVLINDANMLDINGKHCNIQGCRSPKQSLQYVKKDGNYQTWGTCPYTESMTTKEKNQLLLQGNLTDLVDQGQISIERLPSITKALGIYRTYKTTVRHPVVVRWYYGPTGSGKTRRAIQDAGTQPYWISSGSLQWFDGYHGQKVAILDDLRSDSCMWSFLLRLLDEYSIDVPIKGSFVRWSPRLIIITAPCLPEQMFINHSNNEVWDSIEQLKRRIHSFIKFPEEADDITEIDEEFWN